MVTGPLAGIRVLDFSVIYAGPYAGLHLADLGADVIKIESPDGDPFRSALAVIPGNGKIFQYFNRGKRGIVVDLTNAEGRAAVYRLVAQADVTIMNYRVGVAQRLGLDYETLSGLNERLIYADVAGFSAPGPLADRAATNVVGEAYGGSLAMCGKVNAEGAPMLSGLTVADMSTGLALTIAICAALYERVSSGRGQQVHVTLLRSTMSFTGMANMREPVSDAVLLEPRLQEIERVRAAGGTYAELLAARTGGLDQGGSPYYGGFGVKGGAIVLGALTPATRAAARRVLGIVADPQESPDFNAASPEGRAAVRALREHVRATLKTRTVPEWLRIFEEAGVPVSPVNLPEDLAEDPQGRSEMQTVLHEEFGEQLQVRPIADFSRTPAATRGGAPTLGKHTEDVLAEFGFDATEIERLRAGGAVA